MAEAQRPLCGFSERQLLRLCDDSLARRPVVAGSQGIMNYYSHARIVRLMAGLPETFPLHACIDHGVGDTIARPHETDFGAQCMFIFGDEKLRDWKRVSAIPAYKIENPFVWYRRHFGIVRDPDARGTVAFAAHSIPSTDCTFSVADYIDRLKALPDDMQPVSVCLYCTDVLKGLYKPFMAAGFPVYTAGSVFDERFVVRYYDILRRFRYSTSNEYGLTSGSYVYYSIEMGIPFSGVGVKPSYRVNSGIGARPEDFVDVGKNLIEGVYREISDPQRRFVEKMFDAAGTLSGDEMREVLFRASEAVGVTFKDRRRAFRRHFRRRISDFFHPIGLFDV